MDLSFKTAISIAGWLANWLTIAIDRAIDTGGSILVKTE
jgi:hypothetical protein